MGWWRPFALALVLTLALALALALALFPETLAQMPVLPLMCLDCRHQRLAGAVLWSIYFSCHDGYICV